MAEGTARTILITGATDGLGRALATKAAAEGHTLLLHGRTAERLEPVVEEIRSATGNDQIRSYVADFSSLAEVRRLADEVLARESVLHILINNAGIGTTVPGGPERQESQD